MPQSGLRTIGSEQSVPPGHIEAEIAVGLAPIGRVVHAMHVGRHDEQPQHTIELRGQSDITVVEHGGHIQQDFENQYGHRRRADYKDRRELDEHGDDDLAGVKTQPGRDIEFEISVMHPMQSPEERHGMEHHVLAVDGQIKQKRRAGGADRLTVRFAPV